MTSHPMDPVSRTGPVLRGGPSRWDPAWRGAARLGRDGVASGRLPARAPARACRSEPRPRRRRSRPTGPTGVPSNTSAARSRSRCSTSITPSYGRGSLNGLSAGAAGAGSKTATGTTLSCRDNPTVGVAAAPARAAPAATCRASRGVGLGVGARGRRPPQLAVSPPVLARAAPAVQCFRAGPRRCGAARGARPRPEVPHGTTSPSRSGRAA